MDWLFGRLRRRDAQVNTPERSGEHSTASAVADGQDYIFGEGESEISRLNFQHYMFRYAFGSDYLTPIQSPHSILDVACGTGRWAREMARHFPDATVIGFDINWDQLRASLAEGLDVVPENCTFVQGDALQTFDFPSASFDFTMARACSAFIPVAQWPLVVGEMARVTRPGGWVEVRDFGLVRSANPALNELTVKFANMASVRGLHPGSGPLLKQYLQSAHLNDIHVRHIRVRSGSQRATRAGQLMLSDYLALLGRVGSLVEKAGIESEERWRALLRQAHTDTRAYPDEQYAEVDLTTAYGRR